MTKEDKIYIEDTAEEIWDDILQEAFVELDRLLDYFAKTNNLNRHQVHTIAMERLRKEYHLPFGD